MKMELNIMKIEDGAIIVPETIEIEGYYIVGPDDKLIVTLPKGREADFNKMKEILHKFCDPKGEFLVLSHGIKVTVLRKEKQDANERRTQDDKST